MTKGGEGVIMKLRGTLILLALLALLGGYVYFFEVKKPATPEKKATTTVTVLDLPYSDVVGVEVRSEDGEAKLARQPEAGWKVMKPKEKEADQDRVERVIKGLSPLRATRALTEAMDLKAFGLSEPKTSITVTLRDGSEEVLLIGDKNPAGTAYYVQRKGDEAIYLVYTSVIDGFKRMVTNPPFKPTPTPSPTFTPATEATSTPTPTVAPSPTPGE